MGCDTFSHWLWLGFFKFDWLQILLLLIKKNTRNIQFKDKFYNFYLWVCFLALYSCVFFQSNPLAHSLRVVCDIIMKALPWQVCQGAHSSSTWLLWDSFAPAIKVKRGWLDCSMVIDAWTKSNDLNFKNHKV